MTDSAFGAKPPSWLDRLVWKLCDHRTLPAAKRRWLRKRLARHFPGPFDETIDGMHYRLYPAENYCDRVLFGRRDLPERAEHEALLPLLHPGMVFVDIGANVGSYSVFVGSHLAGKATLIAFEPHPHTFQKLVFNLQANGLSTEHVRNAAIADHHGTMALWSDGGSNIGHTSLLPDGTANPARSVEVIVQPLLDALAEWSITRVDLLKIDIEGFEDQALLPFLNNASEDLLPRSMLLETAHARLWQGNLAGRLEDLGYRPQFETSENVLFSRPV